MRPRAAVTVLLLAFPAMLRGQQVVIDPGMNRAQVIGKLGKPTAEKATGTSTYLFYRNGAEKRVGMNDLVVLENDKVVDAVFRAAARKYSGTSSSPNAIPAEVARKHPRIAASAAGMALPAASAPAGAPAQAAAKPAPAESKKMPAQRAQEVEVAKPTPQARSAILDKEKAAAAKAATKADSSKPPKPDPNAPPPKKP